MPILACTRLAILAGGTQSAQKIPQTLEKGRKIEHPPNTSRPADNGDLFHAPQPGRLVLIAPSPTEQA